MASKIKMPEGLELPDGVDDRFKELELDPSSGEVTAEQVKKKWKKLSLKCHPDKQKGKTDKEKEKASERFLRLTASHDFLMDDEENIYNTNLEKIGDTNGLYEEVEDY